MGRRKTAKRGAKARSKKLANHEAVVVRAEDSPDVVAPGEEQLAEEEEVPQKEDHSQHRELEVEEEEVAASPLCPEPSPDDDVDDDDDEEGSGDGSGNEDWEGDPVHTGFMQTGPKNYRCGSTAIDLTKADEDTTFSFQNKDIGLEVECGGNRAMMSLSKLYQGSKGPCIDFQGTWITPNEFQAVSGRESAKDWKRSIRHNGRSLKLLLSKGVLDVHPAACRCDSCRLLQQANEKNPPVDTITFEDIKRKSSSGSPKKKKKKKKKKSKGKVKDKSKSKDKAKRKEKAAASRTELNGDVSILGTAPQVHQDALSTADSSSSSEDEAASDVNDSEEEKKAKLKASLLEPASEPPKRVEAITVKIPRNLPPNPDPQSSSDSSSSGESSSDEDSDNDGSSDEEEKTKGGVLSFDPSSLNEPLFPDLTPTVMKKPLTPVLTKKESSSEDDEPLANINRKQPSRKEPSIEVEDNQKKQYDNKVTNCITDGETKPEISAVVHEDKGTKSKHTEPSTENAAVINQVIPKAVNMDMVIAEEIPQEQDMAEVTDDIVSENSEAKDNSVPPLDMEMRDTAMCRDSGVIQNQPQVEYMHGKDAENSTENKSSEDKSSQESEMDVTFAATQELFSFSAPLLTNTNPTNTINDHQTRTEDLSSETPGRNINPMDFTSEPLRPKTPIFEPAATVSETATPKTSTSQVMSMDTLLSETSVIRSTVTEFPVSLTTPSEVNLLVSKEAEKEDEEERERTASLESRLNLFGQEGVHKDGVYDSAPLNSAAIHDTAPQASRSPQDMGEGELGTGDRNCGSGSLYFSAGRDDCGAGNSSHCGGGSGGGDSDFDHGHGNFGRENGDFGGENGDIGGGGKNDLDGGGGGDCGGAGGSCGDGRGECDGGEQGDCGEGAEDCSDRAAEGSQGEGEDGGGGECGGGGDGEGDVQECGGGGSSENSNAGGGDTECRSEDNLAAASSQLSKIAKQERKPNGNKLSRLSNIIDNLRVTKEKQVLTGTEGEKKDSPEGTTTPASPPPPPAPKSAFLAPPLVTPPEDKPVSVGASFTPLPPVPVLHSAPPLTPSLLHQSQPQHPTQHHQPPVITRIPSPSRQPSSPSRQLPSPSRQLPSPSRQLPSPSRRHVSPPGRHPSPSVQHTSPTPGSRKSTPAWPLSFTSSSAVSPYPGSSLLSSFALSLPSHTSGGSSSKPSRTLSSASSTSSHQSSSAPPSVLSSSRPSASATSSLSSSALPSILSLSSSSSSSLPSMLSLTTAPSSSSSLSSMLSLTSSLPSMLSFSSPSLASGSPLLVGSASSSAYARQQEQLALSLQQAMTRVMTPSEISHAQLMAFQMAQNEAALQQASYIQKMMDMHKLSTSMSLHSKAERDYQMAALSALMPWPPRPDLLNPFHPLAHPHLLAAQQQQFQQQAREKELELEKQKQQQKQREREQQQKREREREREREQQKHRQEQLERKQSQQRLQEQQQQYKLKHLHMMQEQQRKLDAAHLQFQRDMAKRPYDALTAGLALPAEQPQKAHSEAKKPRTSLPGTYPPPPLVPPSTKPRPSHTKVNGSSSSSGSSSSKSGSSTHTPPSLNPFNLPLPLPVSPVAAPRMWSSCFPHPLPPPSLEAAHLSHLYGLSEEASKHLAQAAISANSRTAHTPGRGPSAASATAPSSSSSSSSLSASASVTGGEVLDLSVSKR